MIIDFTKQTKELIDELKKICADVGLGNDGNESKIITQVFLYKFMNDKLGYELKKLDKRFAEKGNWEKVLSEISEADFKKVAIKLPASTARLNKDQTISHLFNKQGQSKFAELFDKTLVDISNQNSGIFSVTTASKARVSLFDPLSQFITDPSKKDSFCKSIINRLVNFSFEDIFDQKFDFFSTIFEYLIKDYNKDGGGKYAEYYTPHAVSKIMAKILVDKPVKNVSVYDPSAGSGTLLMNVAHEIGEKNCSIYSQDISQKSSGFLRLNLILNNLVHSIPNVIQGNTLKEPAHKEGKNLKKFDFIVSNPPFKLDFSDFRDELDVPEYKQRFFAGIPNIPKKDKDKMAIYLLFLQHIINSLSENGSAAIVVPTGFLSAKDAIAKEIRNSLIKSKILRGIISMPSNIFATTGTQVSVIFIERKNTFDSAILLDASKLGTTVKEGKNQKTLLSEKDEEKIINTFISRSSLEDFSTVVNYDEMSEYGNSFNPGQYFKVKYEVEAITEKEFKGYLNTMISMMDENLKKLIKGQNVLKKEIEKLKLDDEK